MLSFRKNWANSKKTYRQKEGWTEGQMERPYLIGPFWHWQGIQKEDVIRLERNDARIVRLTCNVRPEDSISAGELKTRLKSKSVRKCLQDRRLQWYSHLESAWSSKYRTFQVSSSLLRGRPRKTQNEVIRNDLKEMRVSNNKAKDRNFWKSFIRNPPTDANMENRY